MLSLVCKNKCVNVSRSNEFNVTRFRKSPCLLPPRLAIVLFLFPCQSLAGPLKTTLKAVVYCFSGKSTYNLEFPANTPTISRWVVLVRFTPFGHSYVLHFTLDADLNYFHFCYHLFLRSLCIVLPPYPTLLLPSSPHHEYTPFRKTGWLFLFAVLMAAGLLFCMVFFVSSLSSCFSSFAHVR